MKQTKRESIRLGDLTMYIDDLLKMGFISQQKDEDGKNFYKLTDLGIKSGLKDIQN